MDKLTRKRAAWVGVLIIVAYTMLTYDITGNKTLGFITDVISGLAVIGIPVLLYPIFATSKMKFTNWIYLGSRLVEGLLMVLTGCLIVFGAEDSIRGMIYSDIHIWFFIIGAMTFYLLFFVTHAIPKFISLWGLIATGLLLLITVLGAFGIESTYLSILVLPMILNELFLAVWLMVKGFKQT